ncbi:ferritin family protein [Natranaerobius thermophilus]|uniref:Rubrerythrin diiron-binding domain-containing protein n=1 Tax=Natranaerobius thermophilus (strain ATCC BAA-1301 / DSM 18059 / JW/NM-WN-LF) TaxID=457570 RepID=B2A8F3_NATTJ|nr:ferritin family protein [Natranaerobius thermophilus]ACB85837.1 conserved hypothetical protein [Natranaerobius thermophilus JW/NM-WN-LF]
MSTASLTQKEQQYLQEARNYEELCIAKYETYANQFNDRELKNLFQRLADKERAHYNQIDQLMQQYQQPNQQQGQQQNQQS